MVKNIISVLLLAATLSVYAQENPKIDRKDFFSLSGEKKTIRKAIKQGDAYYNFGLYDAALQQYMRLYNIRNDYSPLNYKIAVSHLYGINPKNALAFFERTSSDVATDFYRQKGIALIYHQQFDEATAAFNRYAESLSPREAQRSADRIRRLLAIADFSATAVQDSLSFFVINAGPRVNSYYDDYNAVELLSPSPSLFFTSRRPHDDNINIASHSVFQERILFSPEFVDGQAGIAKDTRLKSAKHLSVAGVDNNTGSLLYFKGKKRFGDIYSVQFNTNGKTTQNRRLNNAISKKTTAEGAISFADNGDAYFISDRLGGVGGKDIWYAKKKGKNSFYRPQNLSNLNTPLNEESVFVTPDGNTLYFSSNGLPGMGGYDIYKSERMPNGAWGNPVNMGYPINGPDDDLFYRYTSDPTLALLSSKRSGGFGGLDIYFVKKDLRIPFELSGNVTDERTGQPLAATVKLFDRETNLPVATALNDTILQRYAMNLEDIGDYYLLAEAPGYRSFIDSLINPSMRHAKIQHDFALEKLLHPYTLNGYVTDVRTGRPVLAEIYIRKGGVLYRTLTDGVTGFYTITIEDKDDFELIVRAPDYFVHNENMSLRDVAEDIGSRNITLQRSIIVYTVTGVVVGEGTNELLRANISASRPDGFAQETVTNAAGRYEMTFTDIGPFLIEVSSEGYFFTNSVLQFSVDSTMVIRNFNLVKMESGARMVIENILFNTGAATLLPESFTELNRLVNLLRENPNVRIEVSGHTDNTGSAAINRTLSRNRALSVRNYLISQGIPGERVRFEGYGFDRPIAPNTTAEGRAANRRVEIEIID
jgi:outer membrane protein OmpA-like peptidoglycan-associated protein/tetratricopeptide (TPR) repeat protein